jgi:pyruvate kinase
MNTYYFKHSRVVRAPHEDDEEQVLKTKIVATLGSLDNYRKLHLTSSRPSANIEIGDVIREFYEHGVDVIRLNLSHADPGTIAASFKKIKRAVRICEKHNRNRKKIAILADLPGPKIRFHPLEPMVFRVGGKFVVHFRDEVKGSDRATVFLNTDPLEAGLIRSIRRVGGENPVGVTNAFEMKPDKFKQLVENALGMGFISAQMVVGPLQAIMSKIESKLRNREDVIVAVGDGEVVMKVIPATFDPAGTTLECEVVSVRTEQGDADAPPELVTRKKKGFTIRDIHFDIPSFTEEDEIKLDELLEAEYERGRKERNPIVAFVALSFAQTADDVLRIKEHIEKKLVRLNVLPEHARLRSPSVIAKIETQKGWDNREYILDVADGIMVARGDLGLQVDIEKVPTIQKGLIRLCNKRGKPVITATQMLSSMTRSIEPTRAEGTDVFNAILDGSDAVMMSEETADGKYPIIAIEKMISIAVQAEMYFERHGMSKDLRRAINRLRFQEFLKDEAERVKQDEQRFNNIGIVLWTRAAVIEKQVAESERIRWRQALYEEKLGKAVLQSTTDSITQATCLMSEGDGVDGIIAATTSGRTVRMISRLRPSVLLTGAAHDNVNTRKLVISYGVLPLCVGEVKEAKGTDGIFKKCEDEIVKDEYLGTQLRTGRTVIFTAGTRLGKPGSTNLIQMRKIGDEDQPGTVR